MNEKILSVQMLGGFELVYGNEPLVLERSKSTKASQLLQYILYHRNDTSVSRNQLLEVLYARENIVDPGNNLKVTLFRLRKLLAASKLPKEEYITFQNGFYEWKCSVPMEIDAHKFNHLIAKSKMPQCTPSQKAEFLLAAIELYQGEFLPMVSTEEWVAVENIQFKKKFLESVRYVSEWLNQQKEYGQTLLICDKATNIYPYEEELYMIMLQCLFKMNRYKDIHTLYNKTAALFFDELGVSPSKDMEDYYKEICFTTQSRPMSLFDIKKKLTETQSEGAYFCNYLAFMESYHIITRIVERCGQSAYLMLCSLEDETKGLVKQNSLNERIREAAESLHKVIRESIRRGDIYTRYNKTQFLVLLTGINQENCRIVSARIHRKYSEESKVRGIRLLYNVIVAADFEA